MKELTENPNIIVFIDELHTLVGAGSAEGSLDAANILKPALVARRDPLHRRDHAGRVPEVHREGPVARAALPGDQGRAARRSARRSTILLGIKDRYEEFHHVEYTREAIEAAVYQSSRYITDRFLPDKAIDLIDEAGARAKLRRAAALPGAETTTAGHAAWASEPAKSAVAVRDFERAQPLPGRRSRRATATAVEEPDVRRSVERRRVVVGKQEIDEVVSKWTGVPLASINQDEGDKLLRMEDELHRRVISQDKAISALSRAIRRSRAGLKNPNRPVGSFVFLGPDRASARPSWRARWRASCSAATTRSSASTCPSTWRSTRCRS